MTEIWSIFNTLTTGVGDFLYWMLPSIELDFWSLVLFGLQAGLGFVLFLFLFPLYPGAINSLVNDPNRDRPAPDAEGKVAHYEKSTVGFFTYLQPGRVKIIERGNRFIRAVMRYQGHLFQGEQTNSTITMRDRTYWEVVPVRIRDGRLVDDESSPLPPPWKKWSGWRKRRWYIYSPVSCLWWGWKQWVYLLTGAVFTGIYPFQKVRVYPVVKYVINKKDGRTIDVDQKADFSDHYRVVDFQFPVIVPSSETQDKIPVSVIANVIGKVRNPYETAYHTDDDWSGRLLAAITDAITSFTRPRPVDEILSVNKEKASAFSDHIAQIGRSRLNRGNPNPMEPGEVLQEDEKAPVGTAYDFGIVLPSPPQILDISPSNPLTGEALGDRAIARVDRDAAKERAKGNAAAVREFGKALKKYPTAAIIPQIEGAVRAAEKAGAGGGIVILGGTGSLDPGQAAILQELRRLREGERGGAT